MASTPPPQNNLKRKASSELPAEPLRTIDAEDPAFQHLVETDAKQYNDKYDDTTAAIRDLLSGPGENADMTQVINSLKRRPELAKMKQSKAVLAQCGIDIGVEVQDGKEVAVVKVHGVVM
ncbi:hypothetical protein PISL3812_08304 [Talaromyces islandicus]|uniref:Uncharacterized protein n=1 Tax=Talaromyces islandicus TaxID=28573 RepID=A0A0U1M8L8_TALIS|nr:hypothetical protein PISL3812_08304 [Talaromyces islandicus]